MLTKGRPFYEFLREERVFCATLAHLLMTRGGNLGRFIEAVNEALPEAEKLQPTRLDEAEVYLEFSFVRDWWDSLGRVDGRLDRYKANVEKHALLVDLLGRIPSLKRLAEPGVLPGADSPASFNACFRESDRTIVSDIASPVHWTLGALASLASGDAMTFRDLCRMKWSFNIKPDLIVMLPDQVPLCIEAKLESREDSYPTGRSDCERYDAIVVPRARVGQVELQQFLFRYLLGRPCRAVVLTGQPAQRPRLSHEEPGVATLAWGTVFSRLDHSGSIEFVDRFLTSNERLGPSYAWDRIWNGG